MTKQDVSVAATAGSGLKNRGAVVSSGAGGKTDVAASGKAALKRGAKRKVYKHIAWLDHLMTGAFGLVLLAMVVLNVRRGNYHTLYMNLASIVAAAGAVWLSRFCFQRIGNAVSNLLPHKPLAKTANMDKFLECTWQLVIHVSFSFWEVLLLTEYSWWTDASSLWLPLEEAWDVPLQVQWYYAMQVGIWTYTAIVHRFVDRRRKDYFVMYAHHVMTVFLVVFSGAFNLHRLGVIVLVVHDMSDIFVDLLKVFNYLNLSGKKFFYAVEILFVVNLASWITWRLYYYPFRVLNFIVLKGHGFAADTFAGQPWLNPIPERVPVYFPCCSLLIGLQVLHVWWTLLFIRLAYRLTRADPHEVGREEYEGDSDDDE